MYGLRGRTSMLVAPEPRFCHRYQASRIVRAGGKNATAGPSCKGWAGGGAEVAKTRPDYAVAEAVAPVLTVAWTRLHTVLVISRQTT